MDNGWVEKCSFQVAKDAKELLDEVCEQMDLARPEIIIERFPPAVFHAAFNYDHEHDELYMKARADVADMLVAQEVLTHVEPVTRNNQAAFRVTGNEQVVRTVHKLLKAKLDRELGLSPPESPIKDKYA